MVSAVCLPKNIFLFVCKQTAVKKYLFEKDSEFCDHAAFQLSWKIKTRRKIFFMSQQQLTITTGFILAKN